MYSEIPPEIIVAAREFVDRVIDRAIEEIEKSDKKSTFTLANGDEKGEKSTCEIKDARSCVDIDWPTSEKMTVRTGLTCVKKMMSNWKSEPSMRGWKFYTEAIGMESNESSDFYNYHTRWSFPTPAYPEPQVTVSVFVTVEASKTKFPNCPVDVTYVFEGTQFAHRPKMQFRAKWIYDVLDAKTMLFKTFKF